MAIVVYPDLLLVSLSSLKTKNKKINNNKKKTKTKNVKNANANLPNKAFNSHGPFYCTHLSCDGMSDGCA